MSHSMQLRAYGALWIAASAVLAWRALPYLGWQVDSSVQALEPQFLPLALFIATVLGIAKGFTVFRRVANRALLRIASAKDSVSLRTLFGARTCLLMGFMMMLGLAIRHLPYPVELKAWLVSTIYPAVSMALLIGSVYLLLPQKQTMPGLERCNELPWKHTGQKI
jgi:hypothetical protein